MQQAAAVGETKFPVALQLPGTFLEREKAPFVRGTLILTAAHHLVFTETAPDAQSPRKCLKIAYSLIQSIERRRTAVSLPTHSASPPTTYQPLQIYCRHFLTLTFLLPNAHADSWQVYEQLRRRICIPTVEKHWAFAFKPNRPYEWDGWDFYRPEQDFLRMGVQRPTVSQPPEVLSDDESVLQETTIDEDGFTVVQTENPPVPPAKDSVDPSTRSHVHWRLSWFNKDHAVSPTYPQLLAVPEKISDAVLFHAAKFRSRGRLPALTFIYKQNNASMTRSSQPLIGLKAKRSIQDERLLEAIFDSNLDLVPRLKKNVIIDARPLGNALANRAMGAGTESTENYRNCKRLFMGIDNIHVMRDSINRLLDATWSPDQGIDKWFGQLESCHWLKHIRTILESANIIVETLLDGGNVLIHCSDGWDRTAQLSSLVSIIMDPHYRSLSGFQTLIEKEWLSFGHKFSDRCGHLTTPPPLSVSGSTGNLAPSKSSELLASAGTSKEEKETAPIFLQFLECTQILMNQFPRSFEFNGKLLLTLQKAVHSGQFGTFLLNNEREREEAQLKQRTQSIWSHIHQYREEFLNDFRVEKSGDKKNVLDFMFAAKDVPFWTDMYCQFDDDIFGGSLVPTESMAANPFTNRPRTMQQVVHVFKSLKKSGTKTMDRKWSRRDACSRCNQIFFQSDYQSFDHRCVECNT